MLNQVQIIKATVEKKKYPKVPLYHIKKYMYNKFLIFIYYIAVIKYIRAK